MQSPYAFVAVQYSALTNQRLSSCSHKAAHFEIQQSGLLLHASIQRGACETFHIETHCKQMQDFSCGCRCCYLL